MQKGKGFISEGDVALLLRRYSTSTILALLQEIYAAAESKLDWRNVVKNTNSGITNAQEYQTLWRHLAYRINLPAGFKEDTEPLEDDSDLEFEVEPSPGVAPEVAVNVSACVKVLTAATGSTVSNSPKNQETCFVIDIPNSSIGWEVRGHGQISSVAIPGSLHMPDAQPVRKKRKLWTSEEDQELIAAVEKCGEGNWATMLKGAFRHERTAAQLSQRWALIRKRRDIQIGVAQSNALESQINPTGTNATGNQLPGDASNTSSTAALDSLRVSLPAGPTSVVGSSSPMPAVASTVASTTPSQDQNGSQVITSPSTPLSLSTGKGRPPMKRTAVPGLQQGRMMSSSAGLVGSAPSGQGMSGGSEQWAAKSGPVSLPISSPFSGRYNTSAGVRSTPASSVGRPVSKSSAGPDPMVQAAAVAAGARIAPASTAASLLKAAQSRNVVHIGPGGVSMGKAGVQSQTGSAANNNVKIGSSAGTHTSPGGTTVHYIRTGAGSSSSLQRASQAKGQVGRSGSPLVAQSMRSVSLTTTGSSGASVSSQKPHPPALSVSAMKLKPNVPHLAQSEGPGGTCTGAVVELSSPLDSDGVKKVAIEDSAASARSESTPAGQKSAFLSSQSVGPISTSDSVTRTVPSGPVESEGPVYITLDDDKS